MTFKEYIKQQGLTVRLVAQKMGVSRQSVGAYGKQFTPTARTLGKMARAMTELGVKTEVVDLVKFFYEDEQTKN